MRKAKLVVAAILAVALFIIGSYAHRMALIGAGYGAQQTCACVFISGRALESCRDDLDPLARKVVSLEKGDGEIRARSMLSSATSRFQPGVGCTLQN
jgi:hypothetical protein